MKAILTNYFKALANVARRGDAREESFYSCLETLLQQVAAAASRSEVHVTTLPKRTEESGWLEGWKVGVGGNPSPRGTYRRGRPE
jgi:hypothetical protein